MKTIDWALTPYQQCAAEMTIVPDGELTTAPEHVWTWAVETGPVLKKNVPICGMPAKL